MQVRVKIYHLSASFITPTLTITNPGRAPLIIDYSYKRNNDIVMIAWQLSSRTQIAPSKLYRATLVQVLLMYTYSID